MKCVLCEEFFNIEMLFSSLFSFPDICPKCKIKYEPQIKSEVFPIDLGEITYIYLYDFPINYKQRNYLYRYYKIFYKFILVHKVDYELFVFLDNQELKTINKWLKYLKPFQKIVFFSLTYTDFTYEIC